MISWIRGVERASEGGKLEGNTGARQGGGRTRGEGRKETLFFRFRHRRRRPCVGLRRSDISQAWDSPSEG